MTGADRPPPAGDGAFTPEPDPETGILTLRFSGSLTLALAERAMESYSSDELGYTATRRLWDLRGVEIRMSVAEIQSLGRASQARDRGTPGRLALLVSNDLAYGLSRMHQVFRESETTAQQVFRDEEAAREWLASDEP